MTQPHSCDVQAIVLPSRPMANPSPGFGTTDAMAAAVGNTSGGVFFEVQAVARRVTNSALRTSVAGVEWRWECKE